MKLVMFQIAGKPDVMPGLLTDRGVVSIAEAVPSRAMPHDQVAFISGMGWTDRAGQARTARRES